MALQNGPRLLQDCFGIVLIACFPLFRFRSIFAPFSAPFGTVLGAQMDPWECIEKLGFLGNQDGVGIVLEWFFFRLALLGSSWDRLEALLRQFGSFLGRVFCWSVGRLGALDVCTECDDR